MRQDKKKTLFKLIENSIGSKLFRNNYFFIGYKSQSKDILKNGKLSCAFYVSFLLYFIKLISNLHTTVEGTLKDLEKSGWYKINKPKKGAIVLWDKKDGHYHIGFYWNSKKAVSNYPSKRKPLFHSLNYQNRKILAFYFHKELE
jgi:hypothetical protein